MAMRMNFVFKTLMKQNFNEKKKTLMKKKKTPSLLL
jgi:hypothetical protein